MHFLPLIFSITVLVSGLKKYSPSVVWISSLLVVAVSPLIHILLSTSLLEIVGTGHWILWGILGYFLVYQVQYPQRNLWTVESLIGVGCALTLLEQTKVFTVLLENQWLVILAWVMLKQITILIGLGITLVLGVQKNDFPWLYSLIYVLFYVVLGGSRGEVTEFEIIKQLCELLFTSYIVNHLITQRPTLLPYWWWIGSLLLPTLLFMLLEIITV